MPKTTTVKKSSIFFFAEKMFGDYHVPPIQSALETSLRKRLLIAAEHIYPRHEAERGRGRKTCILEQQL